MLAEWVIVAIAAIMAGLVLLLRIRYLTALDWVIAACVVGLSSTAAVVWFTGTERRVASNAQLARAVPTERRGDAFVSSSTCRSCHPYQYERWYESYHRTMTQKANRETVLGDFDIVGLELHGRPYWFERRGDEFWIEMPDREWDRQRLKGGAEAAALSNAPRVRRRVVLLTGSHHIQAYWVAGPAGNMLNDLPFVYLLEDQRWIPSRDSFLIDPKISFVPQLWNEVCIMCHSVGGQPRPLPKNHTVWDTRVGELGIACEACHGPAGPHVRANSDPVRRYRQRLESKPDRTIVNPARLSPRRASQICGQCHGITRHKNYTDWIHNGSRYRPGSDLEMSMHLIRPGQAASQPFIKEALRQDPRYVESLFWSDGMVRVSGREYNGLVESGCFQRGDLSCLSCHAMHDYTGRNDQLIAGRDGDEACLQCHEEYRTEVEQHTHHRQDSEGSRCYNCHMPHTTYGLLKAIRSHKIDSPTVAGSVRIGRPNACSLCHLDKTLAWTGSYLSSWYGHPEAELSEKQRMVAAGPMWLLSGDAGQRALIAWHMGWQPAKRASGQGWMAPFLAYTLDDPYPAVRYVSKRSLRRLSGFNDFDYDFIAPRKQRVEATVHALAVWKELKTQSLERTGPEILIDPSGRLQQGAIDRLLQQRDNRIMNLQE